MFEKITPEEAGISSERVKELMAALRRRGTRMHSLLMMKGDKIFAEYYWAPFHKDLCHRMYSETKSYVGVAIGLLAEDGLLDINDPIIKYFPEKLDTPLPEWLKEQTIKNMLTMSTVGGHKNWFSSPDPDRTHLYFNDRQRQRPAGTIWEYDSAGSQVLSSLVEKLSGKRLFDFLYERIFRHLGTFKDATLLKTKNGDSWGDSSMICTTRDMASFARFVMNYGTWNGKRLMNEAYLREATSPVVSNRETAHDSVYRKGYGYQIWCTEEEGFCFNGMGAQYTVCLPKQDLIFVCTADMQGNGMAPQIILGNFFDIIVQNMSDKPLKADPVSQKHLADETADLKLYAISGNPDSPFRAELSDTVYTCEDNPMGWREFSIHFAQDGESGELHYENAQGKKVIAFGKDHNVFGKFPELGYSNEFGGLRTTDGFTYDDAVAMAWLEEKKLMIDVQIIDRYLGNFSMIFAFKGDDAVIKMTKTAEDFLGTYQGQALAHKK